MTIQSNTFPPNVPTEGQAPQSHTPPGSDIQMPGFKVVSVGGMRIINGSGAPPATGSWHAGDLYVDYTNHHTYSHNGTTWNLNT